MQFTVLIEFLVPGLTTTLLVLALLPRDAIPQLPEGIPTGDTTSTLLLLAISYPVGILVNFAIFKAQRRFLNSRVRGEIISKFKHQGKDLVGLCNETFEMEIARVPATSEELRDIFDSMRALVFSRNIERFSQSHLFHEGLQRFSRGMLVPLLMAVVWVWPTRGTARFIPAGMFGLLFILALWLLGHSIRTDEEQAARFFVLLVGGKPVQQVTESRPTLPLEPTAEVAAAQRI